MKSTTKKTFFSLLTVILLAATINVYYRHSSQKLIALEKSPQMKATGNLRLTITSDDPVEWLARIQSRLDIPGLDPKEEDLLKAELDDTKNGK